MKNQSEMRSLENESSDVRDRVEHQPCDPPSADLPYQEEKAQMSPMDNDDDNGELNLPEPPLLEPAETKEMSNLTNDLTDNVTSNIFQKMVSPSVTLSRQLGLHPTYQNDLSLAIVYTDSSFDDNVSAYRNNDTVSRMGEQTVVTTMSSRTGGTKNTLPTTSTRNRSTTTWGSLWTESINDFVRKPILSTLVAITRIAARYPRLIVIFCLVLSFLMAAAGYYNMEFAVEAEVIWTPVNSKPALHKSWIANESGFTGSTRPVVMVFHGNGDNILAKSTVDAIFESLSDIQRMPEYSRICAQSETISDETGEPYCEILGVTQFWESSFEAYHESIVNEADLVEAISAPNFPSNVPVSVDQVFGHSKRNNSTNLLESLESFTVVIQFPALDETEEFESQVLEIILGKNEIWEDEPGNNLQAAINAQRSMGDEALRAIAVDMPKVPLVFLLMSVFTAAVFYKKDKVQSRSTLGFCAVACVLLSLATSYGLLLTIGIPLTSITQVLPFIIFGIGLDDAFIIYGEYRRTDPSKSTEERLEHTVQEVGLSITMTTVTSGLAFALGGLSSIRAAKWLAMYGFPAVVIDFVYQITFFVACIAIDDRRIAGNRRDCCCWIRVPAGDQEAGETDFSSDDESRTKCPSKSSTQPCNQESVLSLANSSVSDLFAVEHHPKRTTTWKPRKLSGISELETFPPTEKKVSSTHTSDRFMEWYSSQLLRPWVRLVVLVSFAVFLVLASMSAMQLTQEFKYTDLVPDDSYVTEYSRVVAQHTTGSSITAEIIFRDVDQSDPDVQEEMQEYINELVTIDAIKGPPEYCWLNHFHMFKSYFHGMPDMTFEEQMDLFLNNEAFYRLHKHNIARNSEGIVTATRCLIAMNGFDYNDVHNQVKALNDQRVVTASQPINQDEKDWPFFLYVGFFDAWEFYATVPQELTLVTIIGVTSVAGIAMLLIPHWSAVLFVLPMICVLYIDLLGVIQWAGVHVNGTSFIALSMAIGLLVDFVMHVLLSFYEAEGNRYEKTCTMLSTMGASILLGGVSTCLGTLPLAFCTSEAIRTIFVVFVALVLLGLTHGLILLPVILSIVGPEDQIGSSASLVQPTSKYSNKRPLKHKQLGVTTKPVGSTSVQPWTPAKPVRTITQQPSNSQQQQPQQPLVAAPIKMSLDPPDSEIKVKQQHVVLTKADPDGSRL